MPHATPPLSSPPPAAPVPVLGQCAPLSEQSTLWEIFTALARVGIHFLIRFLPFTATLARNYPRHWRAFLESSSALVRVLLTVRFAPERITMAQFRKLWRARQLIESLFGRPLPIFHATPLGPRTSSSANATFSQSPSASPESLGARTPSSANATLNESPSEFANNATPLGARTPSSANATFNEFPSASPSNPQSTICNLHSAIPNPHPRTPNTPNISSTPSVPQVPAVPQVPSCSLSHFPSRSRSDADSPLASDAPSASESRSRAHKHAPASLQAIIAQMEAQEAQSQSPHSAFHTPHSSVLPPFIPDVNTLHAALKADTLPPNCAGALLDKPADTLIRALQQVHALLHAFPQLSPSKSPSPSPSQSPSNLQSNNPQSAIHNPQSPSPVIPSEQAQRAFETEFQVRETGEPSRPHSAAPP